jgi:hypothetical protein
VGLAEAARFASLPEAEVACSALNSCGLAAVLFDRFYAGNVWTQQFALSGLRVMVPVEELADARLILRELRPVDRAALQWRQSPGWISAMPVVALAMLFQADGGWAFSLLRQRFTATRFAVVAVYGAVMLLLIGSMAASR